MDSKKREIINLGNLKGPILLFGGVYSNLQALEALIKVAQSKGIPASHCICTGDILGYCAQPEETIQLFRDWGAISIIGNVEEQIREGEEDCGCNFDEEMSCDLYSKNWYPYTQSKISADSIEWMKGLPDHLLFELAHQKFGVVHGSYKNISEFIFDFTSKKRKKESLQTLEVNHIIAGHCGLPFISDIEENKNLWINPGVIGMPANNGNTNVWYAVLKNDPSQPLGFSIEQKQLSYDFHEAKKAMIKNNLPIAYANTLSSGYWDNIEIIERAQKTIS